MNTEQTSKNIFIFITCICICLLDLIVLNLNRFEIKMNSRFIRLQKG